MFVSFSNLLTCWLLALWAWHDPGVRDRRARTLRFPPLRHANPARARRPPRDIPSIIGLHESRGQAAMLSAVVEKGARLRPIVPGHISAAGGWQRRKYPAGADGGKQGALIWRCEFRIS